MTNTIKAFNEFKAGKAMGITIDKKDVINFIIANSFNHDEELTAFYRRKDKEEMKQLVFKYLSKVENFNEVLTGTGRMFGMAYAMQDEHMVYNNL